MEVVRLGSGLAETALEVLLQPELWGKVLALQPRLSMNSLEQR
jgi:hypothetical protein